MIFLKRSIWLIDEILTCTTITLSQRGPGSNGNEEVSSTSQSSRTDWLSFRTSTTVGYLIPNLIYTYLY